MALFCATRPAEGGLLEVVCGSALRAGEVVIEEACEAWARDEPAQAFDAQLAPGAQETLYGATGVLPPLDDGAAAMLFATREAAEGACWRDACELARELDAGEPTLRFAQAKGGSEVARAWNSVGRDYLVERVGFYVADRLRSDSALVASREEALRVADEWARERGALRARG